MPDDEDTPPNTPPSSPVGSTSGGASFVPPTIEELQAALPQYEVLKMIGMGGMGAVFKANQTNLDRLVAIKVLPLEAAAGDFAFAERFQREAQAMAKMHHPRIIAVHDFGKTDDYLYIIMEFVEGTDLSDIIRGDQTLGHEQTLAIVTQICDALQYAHEKGVVHRDIKPANIMLDVNGQVKIADFGLAKLTGSDHAQLTQLTMTNMAMGTPDYVAPEALEIGTEVDHRADIYSLGVMLYQLLTGTIPRGMFRPASERAKGVDPRLDDVVARAMESEPEHRYQNVTELWTDVDHIRSTPDTAALHEQAEQTGRIAVKPGGDDGLTRKVKVAPTNHKTKPSSTNTLLYAFIGIAALIFAAVLAFLIFKPKDDSPPVADSPGTEERTGPFRPKARPGGPGATGPGPGKAPSATRPGGGKGPPARRVERQDQMPATTEVGNPPLVEPNRNTIDLANLDIPAGSIRGSWKHADGTLEGKNDPFLGQPGNRCWFRLPTPLPTNYTFSTSLTPINASDSTNLILPVGDRHVELVFGGKRKHHEQGAMTGLNAIDGKGIVDNGTRVPKHALEKDRTYALELRVATNDGDASVEVDLDGENLIAWSGPESALSANLDQWKGEVDRGHLYLGSYAGAVTRFADLSLSPVPSKAEGSGDPATIPPPAPATPGPPPDAVEFAGNHYMFFTERIRWADAAQRANELGGYLVSIQSKAENDFLHSLVRDSDTVSSWLGLRPQGEDQPWAWEDGTTAADFSNWNGGKRPEKSKPDGTEFRGIMSPVHGGWGIVPETFVSTYIIEWGEPGAHPDINTTPPTPLSPPPPPGPKSEAAQKIAALYAKYEQGYRKTLLADHHIAVNDLNTKYTTALRRDMKRASDSGDLDTTLAFQKEIAALETASTEEAPATTLPALPENTPPLLSDRRQTWLQSIKKLTTTHANETAQVIPSLDRELDALQTTLTRSDDIDGALEVRAARENLKTNGLPFLDGTFTLPATPAPSAGSDSSPPANEGSLPLFNGQNLDGWSVAGNPSNFIVEDGTLRMIGGPSYLFYTGDVEDAEFKNFEFSADVKTMDGANSGIYFHLKPSTSSAHPSDGFEIQIHNGGQDPQKTGSIYSIVPVKKSPVTDDEWFTLSFRIEGNKITSMIDGKTVAEWTQPRDWKGPAGKSRRVLGSGTIAIQNHPGGGDIYFKNIALRPLP